MYIDKNTFKPNKVSLHIIVQSVLCILNKNISDICNDLICSLQIKWIAENVHVTKFAFDKMFLQIWTESKNVFL